MSLLKPEKIVVLSIGSSAGLSIILGLGLLFGLALDVWSRVPSLPVNVKLLMLLIALVCFASWLVVSGAVTLWDLLQRCR